MNRLFYSIMAGGLVTAFGLVCLFVFWLVYPYKTFEAKQPYKIVEQTVYAGEEVRWVVDYCKYTDVAGIVNRSLDDGVTIYFSPIRPNFPKGCKVEIQSQEIPEYVPTGKYHLDMVLEYQMNPIRVIQQRYRSEEFTVINLAQEKEKQEAFQRR